MTKYYIDHIIFGYNFMPVEKDVAKMIDNSEQLSKFAIAK